MSVTSGTPKSIFYRAFTRDRFKCRYCDRNILECFDTFAASQLDHLKPRRAGGTDYDEFNRVTSCGVCNSIKGSFDPSPDGPVTAETFEHAVQVARAHVQGKRKDPDRCSYVRDYLYWRLESARDG